LESRSTRGRNTVPTSFVLPSFPLHFGRRRLSIFSPTLLPFSILACLGVVSFLPFQTVCPFFGTNGARSEDSDHDLFFPFRRIMSAASQRRALSRDHHVSLLTGFSESPKPWKILFATSLHIIFYTELNSHIRSASIQSQTRDSIMEIAK
jgi:hypothetical protein